MAEHCLERGQEGGMRTRAWWRCVVAVMLLGTMGMLAPPAEATVITTLSGTQVVTQAGLPVAINLRITNDSPGTFDLYFAVVPPQVAPFNTCPFGGPLAVIFLANAFQQTFQECVDPNGTVDQRFHALSRSVVIPAGTFQLDNFLTFNWPAGLPNGAYVFVFFGTAPNALASAPPVASGVGPRAPLLGGELRWLGVLQVQYYGSPE